jgi:hypothetical protein
VPETVDLQSLKEIDSRTKPCDADNEWITAHAYYDDVARSQTQARLKQIGAGIKDNPRPLEVSLLRRIIDRLAVVYDRAPTRWLVDSAGRRLSEDSTSHGALTQVYERSQFDLAMRRVDRLRALMRQVGVRYYANDAKRGVSVRIFEPYNMIREPDYSAPDLIDSDKRFALMLSGTQGQSGAKEVWEYWDRNEAGLWRMRRVNETGEMLDEQPFASTNLVNPYPELPVQIIFDDFNGGTAWLPPKGSRTSWVEAINALSNDLWALVLHEAHTLKVVKTDDSANVPRESAPGMTWVIPAGAEAFVLASNAQLNSALEILNNCVRLWTLSEDLPASEFDKSKQVVTGATLKVQNGPLLARREAQVPLAVADEATAYRKLRAVHNLHVKAGAAWGLPLLDELTELEVEIADVEIPTDAREVQEAAARSLAMGSASMVDVIMAEKNIPRHQAIKHFQRVKDDNEKYPARISGLELQTGPKLSDFDPPNGPEEIAGTASVVDAIASGSSVPS